MDLTTIGLTLIEDFITSEEEAFLLSKIEKTDRKNGNGRNSIRRYGSREPYNSNIASDTVPEHFQFVIDRLKNHLPSMPDSVSINEYQTGQEIHPHIDSETSGEIISVLSLLSPAVMDFCLISKKYPVLLPPRSLVQMRGEIRHKWKHSIQPVASDRFSIVFRCSKDNRKKSS